MIEGYVIMRGGLVSPSGGACGTRLFYTLDPDRRPWTLDADRALRFARAEDASLYALTHLSPGHDVVDLQATRG